MSSSHGNAWRLARVRGRQKNAITAAPGHSSSLQVLVVSHLLVQDKPQEQGVELASLFKIQPVVRGLEVGGFAICMQMARRSARGLAQRCRSPGTFSVEQPRARITSSNGVPYFLSRRLHTELWEDAPGISEDTASQPATGKIALWQPMTVRQGMEMRARRGRQSSCV